MLKHFHISYIIDSSKPTNKEPPNEVSYTAYIRLNHFKEILSQFQAKETTEIPEEIYNKILIELKKERIENMALLTKEKLREILKKINENSVILSIEWESYKLELPVSL